jgi:Ca2+/Na+ antiporter
MFECSVNIQICNANRGKTMFNYTTQKDFFMANVIIFIANIIIGALMGNIFIVVISIIGLCIAFYVFEKDYTAQRVWIMDQILLLSILVPGWYMWLSNRPSTHPISGLFFMSATLIYLYGLKTKKFNHHQDNLIRERWHVYTHLLTSIGHHILAYSGIFFL